MYINVFHHMSIWRNILLNMYQLFNQCIPTIFNQYIPPHILTYTSQAFTFTNENIKQRRHNKRYKSFISVTDKKGNTQIRKQPKMIDEST